VVRKSKKEDPGKQRVSGVQEFLSGRPRFTELSPGSVCLFQGKKFLIRKEKMRATLKAVLGAVLIVFLLGACPPEGGGNLPLMPPEIPAKMVTGGVSPVKALCYIDTELYNPLNAGAYLLEANRAPFFDYVVLGAAQIRYNDNRGVWLSLPPSLRYVLERRETYVKSLKMKGIQVLLGVTGGEDNFSFGSLDDDNVHDFTGELMDVLKHYGLDGFEFYDANAGAAVYPSDLPANLLGDWNNDEVVDQEDEDLAWYYGGDKMNNLMYRLRLELDKISSNGVYPKTIVVREENFGRYFPLDVSGSADIAVFVGTLGQTDYFVNPYFDRFVSDSAQRGPDETEPLFAGFRNQYGPMAVNLGGGTPRVVPNLDSGDADSIVSYRFFFKNGGNPGEAGANVSGECDYGILCFYNLKATSDAASEDYLVGSYPNPNTKYTQAGYISLISEFLFGSRVICPSGGNYKKTW
jgi:hypothetical protein